MTQTAKMYERTQKFIEKMQHTRNVEHGDFSSRCWPCSMTRLTTKRPISTSAISTSTTRLVGWQDDGSGRDRQRHRPDVRATRLPRHLYNVFASQTYPFKELRILDDSPGPSMFFAGLGDPRVHYAWTPRRMSIGAKRNQLISESVGRIIMHQDDDDLYRRQYMATMVGRLGRDALTKLSVWDAKSAYDGSIWRWGHAHDEQARTTP